MGRNTYINTNKLSLFVPTSVMAMTVTIGLSFALIYTKDNQVNLLFDNDISFITLLLGVTLTIVVTLMSFISTKISKENN